MAASTWAELTKGLDADDLAKLTAFRDACRALRELLAEAYETVGPGSR